MNKAPAFQFYADDFIGGTITMSHEERGLYVLALCEKCHNATHEPEDDDIQITEWESGIALLTRGSNWPHELWRLAELLNVDFQITLKDLIAFLERRAKEGSL